MKIQNQSSIPSQQTDSIQSEPVSSRGYDPSGESADSKQIVRKQQVRKIDFVTHSFRSFEQIITTESTTLLTENRRRRYLMLQNKGGGTAQIAFGNKALDSGVNSISLPPGTSISFENGICPNNDVYAICLPTTIIAVVEGLRD